MIKGAVMKKIVGIGANVFDTLLTVDGFPPEDTKKRADIKRECGGGPCATGLVAAAKLGAPTEYIGVFASDSGGSFLKGDMEKFGVDISLCKTVPGCSSFSSVVIINSKNASRTCIFNRGNLPPLEIDSVAEKEIKNAAVLMVDGNELSAAIQSAKIARENGVDVLYDAGGLYDGIDALLGYANILIPSEEFSMAKTGCADAKSASVMLYKTYKPDVVVITCGKRGGVVFDGKELLEYPAFSVDAVDTNGAGDVFHGAFAFCRVMGYNYYSSCIFSSAVSALKCTKTGARDGTPYFEKVIEFLKQKGIDTIEFEKNME